jgi:hypothetical protein
MLEWRVLAEVDSQVQKLCSRPAVDCCRHGTDSIRVSRQVTHSHAAVRSIMPMVPVLGLLR